MDFAAILEEVTLEGLDGITLDSLCLRLTDHPDLGLDTVDDGLLKWIWDGLIKTPDLEFYSLPQPRQQLVIFKYNKFVHPGACKGIFPFDIPEDLYSTTTIDELGEIGACDDFQTRIRVTTEVRDSDMSPLMSLVEAKERWGERLVIVASQRQRFLMLLGSTFNVYHMPADLYVVIEKIARARYDGELTNCLNKRGLNLNKKLSFGNLFMKIKKLMSMKLITKQEFIMEHNGSRHSTRIHHLKRFYTVTRANIKTKLQDLSRYLMTKPNHSAAYHLELVKDLPHINPPTKKHVPMMKKVISISTVPFRKYFPDATEKQWKNKNGFEKQIKVATLIQPFNLYDDANADDSDEDEEEEEGDKDEERGDNEDLVKETEGEPEPIKKPVSNFGFPYYHLSLLGNIKKFIDDSGSRGINLIKLNNLTGLNFAVLNRSMSRLIKLGLVKQQNRSYGKTSSLFYVSPEFCEEHSSDKQPETERATEINGEEHPREAEVVQNILTKVQEEDVELQRMDHEEMDRKLTDMNVIWEIDKVESIKNDKTIPSTPRKEDRRAFIIKCLKQRKVYPKMRYLMDDILEYEKDKKEKMCRKSFNRLMSEIYAQGQVYYVKAYCNKEPFTFLQQIIVDSSVAEDDPRIKRALLYIQTDFLHRRFHFSNNADNPVKNKYARKKAAAAVAATATAPSGDNMVSVCAMLHQNLEKDDEILKKVDLKPLTKEYAKKHGITFGLLPKFERLRLFHKYIFYLLYDYQGCCKTETIDEAESSKKTIKPHLYLDVSDWRRYLPPLVRHNNVILPKRDGICMIGDLLINMPLYVYCNIINIRWEVPGLKEALDNPETKLCPLNHLPSELLSPLLYRRRYIPRIVESVQLMCQMGLLTFAPKSTKREMEYLTVYLHKQAMLLNTETSLPGNMLTSPPTDQPFPRVQFIFSTIEDIDKYWQAVRTFGNSTRLGQYSFNDVPGDHGEINLIDCCRQKDLSEIQEVNWLPGDRRGAGGIDSSLFIHRPSNWQGKAKITTLLKKSTSQNAASYTGKSGKTRYIPSTKPSEPRGFFSVETERDREISKQAPAIPVRGAKKRAKKLKLKALPKPSEKKFGVNSFHRTRKVMKQRLKPFARRVWTKKRTPYLDDKDKESMKLMDRVRSRFTPVENGMLLICQVASWFLSPKYWQIMCVTFKTIRDIVHEVLPLEAKDKTRNALKGKYTRLSNEEKFNATAVHFLTLANVDQELVKKYSNHKLAKNDEDFPKLFRNLVMDLLHKFRNYKNIKFPDFPESFDDMHQSYTILRSFDLLEQPIKVSSDVERREDAHVFVLWELLQSMLHLEDRQTSLLSYYMLRNFEDNEVSQALELLQQAKIITQLKKDSRGIRKYLRNVLPHAKKVTQRHKESLRSKAPIELLFNAAKQLSDLFKAKPRITTAKEITGKEEKRKSQPSSKNMDTINSACSKKEIGIAETRSHPLSSINQLPFSVNFVADKGHERSAEVSDSVEYMELDLEQYQAGASLALVSLLDTNTLHTTIDIPDEMVKLDTSTMKKLEQGQVSGRKRKSIKDGSRSWLTKKGEPDVKKPKLINAEKEDSSVEDEPSASFEISSGAPSSSVTSSEILQTSSTKQNTMESHSTSFRQSASIDQCHQTDPSSSSNSLDDKYEHLYLRTNNLDVSYRRLKADGTQFLNEFQVSLASGSLLTLARQAAIDDMDIRTNRFTFSQNFELEPLKMRHTLKGGTVDGLELAMIENRRLVRDESRERIGLREEINPEIRHKESIHCREGSDSSFLSDNPEYANDEVVCTSTQSYEIFKNQFEFMESILTESLIKRDPLDDIKNLLPASCVEKSSKIVNILNMYGFKGALESEIEEKIGESIFSLWPLLRQLQKIHAIFSVGMTHRRYVSRPYSSDWLVKTHLEKNSNNDEQDSNSKDSNTKVRYFQARLWRKMCGSLNCSALSLVLHKLVTLLIRQSGMSLQSLCFCLNPDLLPVATLDLVDMLRDFHCLDIECFPKTPKQPLFSPRKLVPLNGSFLSSQCVTSVRLSVHAPLCVGQMLGCLRLYCPEDQSPTDMLSPSETTGNPETVDDDIEDTQNIIDLTRGSFLCQEKNSNTDNANDRSETVINCLDADNNNIEENMET